MLLNWARNRISGPFFLPCGKRFGPSVLRRSAASAASKPRLGSTRSFFSTSSADMACQVAGTDPESGVSAMLTFNPPWRFALAPDRLSEQLRSSGARCVLTMIPPAEKMGRRTPRVICDPVQASGGVDALEGLCGGQLSRRDCGEDRGAMLGQHCVQRLRRAFDLGERRADFGGGAPTDRLGAGAQPGLAGNGFVDGLGPAHGLFTKLSGAQIVRAAG